MKHARQVGVDELLPDLVGHLVQRPGADDPGVGHQDVETAQAAYGFVDRVGKNRCGVAHVHRDRETSAANLLDLLGRAPKIVLGAQWVRQIHRPGRVGDDDICALGGQCQGMRAALPPRFQPQMKATLPFSAPMASDHNAPVAEKMPASRGSCERASTGVETNPADTG